MPRATIHQLHTRQTPGADGRAYVPPESDRHPIAQRLMDDLERLRDDTPDLFLLGDGADYSVTRRFGDTDIDPPTWREELADDWRSFVAEVRRSPVSHLLVALAGFLTPLVLVVVPVLIAERF